MKPIQIISQDLFDKVRSRFSNLEMGDESGAVTIDPAEARFFDFDLVHEGVNMGRVSISINDIGSLKVYYSQGITENQDDYAKKLWYSFLKEMRFFAMRRLLRFDTRDIAKNNLDRDDFQYLASKNASKDQEDMKQMNEFTRKIGGGKLSEGKWNSKSSRKTSRAVKGKTEVIVRHNRPVDEMYPGSRSQRKNIKAIFIQNRDGERFKYPFIHPAGAFAMAQHVDHGGVPHDPAGKAIMRMSEQIAQLQEFQRKVQHSQLHDDAMGITERALTRLHELKSCIESLGKRHHYEAWMSQFNGDDTDQNLIDELDPLTMEDYKSKFTETSFKEDLAKFFPLIHSIMQETNTIDLAEYVESHQCSTCHNDPCTCDDEVDEEILGALGGAALGGLVGGPLGALTGAAAGDSLTDPDADEVDKDEKVDEFSKFEDWADAVEQQQLTDDQINDLKSAIEELESTGQTLELGPDGQTAWQFFSEFGLDDSDLENKLASAAEVDQDADPMVVLQSWAQENYPELLVALGISNTTTQEPGGDANMNSQPTNEGMAHNKNSMVQEIAKIVKSFYNRDNPNVGPFRGSEGIAIDVEKKISEMFGEQAGVKARKIAEQFMEKLTTQWEERHGKPAGVADDGLARLKELVGNLKHKVEGIGDQGEGGRDFNKNIMPAEGYWKDAMKAAEKSRKDRQGKPFEKNPASHDEKGIYKGDKDLRGRPVDRPKSVSEELSIMRRLSGL